MISLKGLRLALSAKAAPSIRSKAPSSYRSARSVLSATSSQKAESVTSDVSAASFFSARSRFSAASGRPSALSLPASKLSRIPSVESDVLGRVQSWLGGTDEAPDTAQAASEAGARQAAETAVAAGTIDAAHSAAHARIVRQTLTPGSWGGNLELVALARALGVAIHVIPKDPKAKLSGSKHVGRVRTVVNAGRGPAVYVAFGGEHYDALTDVKVGKDGRVKAKLAKVPPDGDCLYHAVSVAALKGAQEVTGAMTAHQVRAKMREPVWAGVFAGERDMQPGIARYVMQQAYALQARYDAANELAKPQYAEGAYLQELAGI